MARNKVEIVEFEACHAESLAPFIARVWDADASAFSILQGRDELAEAAPGCTDGRIPTVLFILNEQVVGHLTTIPERIWYDGETRRVNWMIGFHVLEEHRNGPIGVMIAKEMLRIEPSTLTLTVAEASQRIYEGLGYSNSGAIPNFVRPVRRPKLRGLRVREMDLPGWAEVPAAIACASGLASLAWGIGARVNSAVSALRSGAGPRVSPLEWNDDSHRADFDALWGRAAQHIRIGLVRDWERLQWRFGNRPEYFALEARRDGRLDGYAVLRVSPGGSGRFGGLRLAAVSDILFDPTDRQTGHALLNAAERFLGSRKLADALLVTAAHPLLQQVLRRSGFFQIAGNLKLIVHPSIYDDAEDLAIEDWWLARGDGDADQSF